MTPDTQVQAAHGEAGAQHGTPHTHHATREWLRHRRTTLHGGPLNGHTTRIYPTPGGKEPTTITICHAINWPHWQPAWTDYHRHPDGTYHHQKPAWQITQ